MDNLDIILTLLSIFLLLIPLYQSVFIPLSFGKLKKRPRAEGYLRFAIVVSARNEESVIGYLLDSLNAQNYPADRYSVFVVADNCTDNTRDIARQKGAITFERNDLVHIGKGYALSWFFKKFNRGYRRDYDAITIFDADNLVSPEFLSVMNHYLSSGEAAVMGYRDSKNPHDSWVSGGTSMMWWSMSRFYHMPRARLGLSALAGGTGYCFRSELVENGWNTGSLCEDTEFSMQLMMQGRRLAFAPEALFFDEQPVDMRTSITQRYRWAVGTYQCVVSCSPKLLISSLTRMDGGLAVDGLMFLLITPSVGLSSIVALAQLLMVFTEPLRHWRASFSVFAILVVVGFVMCALQGLLLLKLEHKPVKPMLGALMMYPLFLYTTAIINLIVIFYRNPRWRPIKHKKSISLDQLQLSATTETHKD